jgi:hypothetical protein
VPELAVKPGLYEARSLVGGGKRLVVLDDAEARIDLRKAVMALGAAYALSTERSVRDVIARALRDMGED